MFIEAQHADTREMKENEVKKKFPMCSHNAADGSPHSGSVRDDSRK